MDFAYIAANAHLMPKLSAALKVCVCTYGGPGNLVNELYHPSIKIFVKYGELEHNLSMQGTLLRPKNNSSYSNVGQPVVWSVIEKLFTCLSYQSFQ